MEDETDAAELKEAVADGLAQSLRGESAPVDFRELKQELRARLSSRA